MNDYKAIKKRYNLMNLEDALVACFGKIESGDGDTEGYKVSCCGEVRYGSGIMGSDIVECQKCHRRIVNVLSPHTSPLLIDWDTNTTSLASEEAMEALWETPWMVIIPEGLTQDYMERIPDHGVQPDGSVVVKHTTRQGKGHIARLIGI